MPEITCNLLLQTVSFKWTLDEQKQATDDVEAAFVKFRKIVDDMKAGRIGGVVEKAKDLRAGQDFGGGIIP